VIFRDSETGKTYKQRDGAEGGAVKKSCGLRSIDLIIKAASPSSSMPFSAKEAAMGIAPYIHRGEAIPIREAGTTPKILRLSQNQPGFGKASFHFEF
jgi:hypothetical protein